MLYLNQNSYLRILFNLKKFDNITPFFISSKILRVHDLFIIFSLKLLFKIKKLNYCQHFNDDLIKYNNICKINFKKTPEFHFCKPRTNYQINSALLVAMRLWNILPLMAKNSTSLSGFKGHICRLISEELFRSFV